MKKIIAINLLIIHLLNVGGALAFHQLLVYKTDRFFDEQVDKNNYYRGELTEIKIPVNMAGITDWKSYADVKGSVQFGNAAYNYVKIKLTRTALYLVCMPNYKTTHLFKQNVIDARQIPDIPIPKKEHVQFGKVNLPDYSYQDIQFSFSNPLISVSKITDTNYIVLPNLSVPGPGQPPDTAA